ncbi:hypothetical protein K491DRAFT_690078 [Lophiostoma macrostomum CBS 122681]|uniref:Uncharacterized protein n=1 Tax=Lophiostoma macrostomum CBS 122681 TaxID=1314788 RepID=A0A6A6TGV5_9PLEO|nr:hypothetical protein K491DRAFT_690078 [Lophiostoma macrostomum CBS 122681]
MSGSPSPGRDAVVDDKKNEGRVQHSVLNSNFPVLLPYEPALFMSEAEYHTFVKSALTRARNLDFNQVEQDLDAIAIDAQTPGAESVASGELKRRASGELVSDRPQKAPFMDALRKHQAHVRTTEDLAAENKSLTDNADLTNISSKNPLVDLFYDLSESTDGSKLQPLLEQAWNEDPLMTLKIMFNARSIHLGKSNKVAAYKALGWLAQNHPATFLASLRWLVRPVIEKKVPKTQKEEEKPTGTEQNANLKSEEEDFEMIDTEKEETTIDPNKAHDVRFGVSHGYWKDLLNLVVFAANNQLKVDGDPTSLLSQRREDTKASRRTRNWDAAQAKELRKQEKLEQHKQVVEKLEKDQFYRALHTTVARLFAEQLKEDAALLNSGKKSNLRKLSLAAKWAPTFGEFHDKHTFILSSIAEILYPVAADICPDASNRELYLRCAREAYRKNYASPLRKALLVVERDIAANRFDAIKYERVPSLAMQCYTPLFIKKDYEHFSEYIDKVAGGKMKISGATLLPSTLVSKARKVSGSDMSGVSLAGKSAAQVKAIGEAKVGRQVLDGQWKSLVQRIRDSGTLESSIAVCDVSGSMSYPRFKDGSCPMDSSIGLALLLAEVTAPPFGGAFITFSNQPSFVTVGGQADARDFVDKVRYIEAASWSMNTNLVSVFEDLILPMVIENEIKQEDMVKQVFVFSDMQFDAAQTGPSRWMSSFERIEQKYAEAGYEMPKLIFWNLAADATDKPTTIDDANTALVSGYSQGMLKTFLDGGGFEDTGEEEVVEEDGEEGIVEVKVKQKMDSMTVVRKAVSHKAYSMLEVLD